MTIKIGFAAIAATLVLQLMPDAMAYDRGNLNDQVHIETHAQQRTHHQIQGHRHMQQNHIQTNHYNHEVSKINDQADAQLETRRHDDEQRYRNHLDSGNVHNYSH